MKSSRFIFALAAVTFAFFLFGCSGKPLDQIDMTEKARQAAVDEAALEFAPQDWQEAETDWATARRYIEQEKWGEATTALMKAKAHYAKARDIAAGLREQTIKEINGTQETARQRCDTLKKALDANAKKIPAAKLKDLQEACKTAEENIAKVATQMSDKKYQDAKYLSGTTLRAVWESQTELDKILGKKK